MILRASATIRFRAYGLHVRSVDDGHLAAAGRFAVIRCRSRASFVAAERVGLAERNLECLELRGIPVQQVT